MVVGRVAPLSPFTHMVLISSFTRVCGSVCVHPQASWIQQSSLEVPSVWRCHLMSFFPASKRCHWCGTVIQQFRCSCYWLHCDVKSESIFCTFFWTSLAIIFSIYLKEHFPKQTYVLNLICHHREFTINCQIQGCMTVVISFSVRTKRLFKVKKKKLRKKKEKCSWPA